ncbi:MAG: B12-binding domain-containing radical SAM protein [Nitrospirae bacterium]|nr:B12-binding domain-containing radical SAM protein [Nitrospirota bacterium]
MKLSLVFPSWFGEFGSFSHAAKKVSTFPPLNLCIVAAIAEQEGWEVQLIDAHIEQLDHPAVVSRVKDFQPDLIGLTATTPFFHNATLLARTLKQSMDVPVVIGGTHVSIVREKAFEECYDYLFIGECEMTFPDFLRSYAAGNRTPQVAGVMMRQGNEVLYHGDPPFLEDLDKAPLAARHLLPNDRYFMGTLRGRKLYTSMQMSRGCPFNCVFCACDLHGKRFRLRSLDNVMQELEYVIRDLRAEHVYFVDDTLTLNRKFIMELCDEIEKRGLKFTFEGSTRANLWDEEMVRRLKQCGLIRISFGLESADPTVREIIRKNVPLDSYAESNRLSNRLGIETINSVIIGLPGDTRESIERTVEYLCKARDLLHVTLNIAIPYPGTEMLKMAESGDYGLKLIERDFSKYQRYESAVMEVNGIAPAELIELQKKALARIYSRWWRIIPTLKRFGFMTVFLTAFNTVVKPRFQKMFGPRGA